uniref:G-protein coupled receptors family 1 profile domain-containing protein n=1 Tax=Plectus sambesii TaxID=2011161 RepID=A0A914WGG4_9BILA
MTCGALCAADWISIVANVLTIPVYTVLLVVLFVFRRSLNSTFFTFCISTGVADLWISLHKFAFTKIPRVLFYDDVFANKSMATMSKMGVWYIYLAQVFGVLLMSLNRYTALVYPLRHKTLWSPTVIFVALLLQWLLPLITVVPMLFPQFHSHFANITLHPTFDQENARDLYFLVDGVIEGLLLTPLFVTLYVCMFVKSRNFAVQQRKRSIRRTVIMQTADECTALSISNMDVYMPMDFAAEKRLACTGLVLTVSYVAMNVPTVATIFYDQSPPWISYAWYFANDVFTMSNPYLLLLFGAQVRRCFIRYVTLGAQ